MVDGMRILWKDDIDRFLRGRCMGFRTQLSSIVFMFMFIFMFISSITV